MVAKSKISVTIDDDILNALDTEAKSKRTSRSYIMNQILLKWKNTEVSE